MTADSSPGLPSARLAAVRARVVVADVLVLTWCLVWGWVAAALRDAVRGLAAPGAEAVSAGERLSGTLDGAGNAAARVPLVGDSLAAPLHGAAEAGTNLAQVGRSYQAGVSHAATAVFWGVIIVTVGLVLATYLWWRLVRVRLLRSARELRDSPGGLALLGLRFATSTSLPRLARLTAGTWPGERAVLNEELLHRLGRAELGRLGLRPPRRPTGWR